jgi:hypothetical protein
MFRQDEKVPKLALEAGLNGNYLVLFFRNY